MEKRYKIFVHLCYIILFICLAKQTSFAQQKDKVISFFPKNVVYKALILDAETSEVLPMALWEIEEISLSGYSNAQGIIKVKLPRNKRNNNHQSYTLSISYLGYAPFKTQIKFQANGKQGRLVRLRLQPSSYALKDVLVLGEQSRREAGTTKIKKEALEYLQPTSLQDVLLLTAGGLVRNPGLRSVQQIQMREVRVSDNSTLGTAIILDDAPISNDANLQGMGNNNQRLNAKTTMNSGLDLRLISVDQVESIEVMQGIPSVRYGNLTSGLVRMQMKSGYSPLNIRVQADPYTKLLSINKGFKLGNSGQSLMLGGDYTKSNMSVVNPISDYRRISSLMKYAFVGKGAEELKLKLSLMYTGAIDQNKFDPEVMNSEETYKSTYNRLAVNGNFSLKPRTKWIESLEGTFSFAYLHDKVHQEKWISPRSTLVQPLLKETGEGEGHYLPSSYFSIFDTDGKPLSVFAQIRSFHRFQYKNLNSLLLLGSELKWHKNMGLGTVYDPKLPPNPGSALSSRPIAYKDISGAMPLAFFAEETMFLSLGKGWKGKLRAGLRLTKDLMLSNDYTYAGKWLLEPRVQGSITLPKIKLGAKKLSTNIYLGYGKHIKMPTLNYLYPNKGYYDFVEANYYHQDPSRRFLWIRTYVKERTNKELKVNSEAKWDFGFNLAYAGAKLFINLFHHKTSEGFQYRSMVNYMPYNSYTYQGVLGQGKPTLDLFDKTFTHNTELISQPANSIETTKEGLEYSLSLPKIQSLKTNITIQGSYYKTTYNNSMPMAYRPQGVQQGKVYPYIGFYTGRGQTRYSRLHTLLRTDTHIPKLRLIFSSNLQTIWFTKRQELPYSGRPNYWFDEQANRHSGEDLDLNDPLQKQLYTGFVKEVFDAWEEPVSMSLNMKMTKEFSKHIKVSFFVNNLLTYNPVYKSNLNTRHQRHPKPFFGSELRVKW